MFTHFRTKGFILNKIDVGEADRIFSVFTEKFGKIKVLGKSIRKIDSKLRSGMPLFSVSEIAFVQGKNFKILTDAILLKDFNPVRDYGVRQGLEREPISNRVKQDLERLKIGFRILNSSNRLIKGQQKDEKIWQLFSKTFKVLNSLKFKVHSLQLIYYFFLFNLLKILGYGPYLTDCVVCGNSLKKEQAGFGFEQKGLICYSCFNRLNSDPEWNGIKIEPRTLDLLRKITAFSFADLKKDEVEQDQIQFLERFSENYLRATGLELDPFFTF